MPQLTLLVLRAKAPNELARLYALFGCSFVEESHGNGPVHLSSEIGGLVLEIYPRGEGDPNTGAVRLGFLVENLEAVLAKAEVIGARLLKSPASSPWGLRAVIVDSEGHKIELTEKLESE
ncbi:VOC family protein [Asticcacaulis sp. ZE23SCel15]|uniref:VOC family protein n=1 Tax=Asticcacaulis sp. ZE23SCel15 TaxID=3059027 RepID=UPI00349EAFBE